MTLLFCNSYNPLVFLTSAFLLNQFILAAFLYVTVPVYTKHIFWQDSWNLPEADITYPFDNG